MSIKIDNNFENTTFPECDSFTQKNNSCCGDKPTNLNYYNKDYNQYNNINNKRKLTKLIFTTLKYSRLIYTIAGAVKMARSYYNQNKNYCVSINMSSINNGNGKLTLYLNPSCTVSKNDLNTRTYLTRVFDQLPTLWGCYDYLNNPISFCKTPYENLTNNEKILRYYMKHTDFFVNLLSALKQSIYDYAKYKDYCKVFTVPKYFSSDKTQYKVGLTGKEMKMLYCMYLRNSSGNSSDKLPFTGKL
jgi:hypothetical protein